MPVSRCSRLWPRRSNPLGFQGSSVGYRTRLVASTTSKQSRPSLPAFGPTFKVATTATLKMRNSFADELVDPAVLADGLRLLLRSGSGTRTCHRPGDRARPGGV